MKTPLTNIAILLYLLATAACKKNIPSPISGVPATNFSQVFEDFWNGMNINYLYWDIDTTDWDRMYTVYKPLFAGLDINDKSDIKRSVNYLRDMTEGLTDSHYSISFDIDPITDSIVFPALDRKLRQSSFHSPFLFMNVDSGYFDKGKVRGTYITSSQQQISAVCATINNNILYFSCNQFGLQEAYQSPADNGVKNTLQYFFNQLQNLPPAVKGMIIDVRNNSGGNLADLNFFVGHLLDQPLHLGATRYKSGNGRLSYTPWLDAFISPQAGSKAVTIPIIVLADNYSVSLAEMVAMAIHALPNGRFVGEKTWGATGPATDNAIYNDGPFAIPGFLSTYMSSSEFKYVDGEIYEGKGFPPDVEVPFNLATLLAGDDPQLDKAIMLIN